MRTLQFSTVSNIGARRANDVMLFVAQWAEVKAVSHKSGTADPYTYEVSLRKGTSRDEVAERLRQTADVDPSSVQ